MTSQNLIEGDITTLYMEETSKDSNLNINYICANLELLCQSFHVKQLYMLSIFPTIEELRFISCIAYNVKLRYCTHYPHNITKCVQVIAQSSVSLLQSSQTEIIKLSVVDLILTVSQIFYYKYLKLFSPSLDNL